MNLLALDTATEACSVALAVNGAITEHYEVAPQQHVRKLLPTIDRLLAAAGILPVDLDGVAFGCGPGSFTGVRIAVSAAQAIGFATGCPLVPVSTLAAMAHRAFREEVTGHCLPMIDARMNQVYWAAYETNAIGMTQQRLPEQVSDPSGITLNELSQSTGDSWSAVGTGYEEYRSVFLETGLAKDLANGQAGARSANALLPAAIDILHLSMDKFRSGQTVTAEHAAPVYLRDKVALTEAERAAQG